MAQGSSCVLWVLRSWSYQTEVTVLSGSSISSEAGAPFPVHWFLAKSSFLQMYRAGMPAFLPTVSRGCSQLIEATCHLLSRDPHHNMAVCFFKASRRTFEEIMLKNFPNLMEKTYNTLIYTSKQLNKLQSRI